MLKPALSKTRLLPFRIFLCLVQKELLLCAVGERFHFDFYLKGQKDGFFFIPDFSFQFVFVCAHSLFPLDRSESWLGHDVWGCWHMARNYIEGGEDGSGCLKILNTFFFLEGGQCLPGENVFTWYYILRWVGIKLDWDLCRVEFTKKSMCNSMSDKV